ncbi:MAG: GNAT family N-acetyltransferase [Clostridia bacterium]|nr:GNAT family N-acetyltransferase [Clostridia bacterium]
MECYLPVTEENIAAAALIHSASWQESYKSFCSPEFVKKHTPLRQEAYLRGEMETGKRIWMLEANGELVGIVSVWESLIENLYVHPARQNCGHGTRLLRFAMEQCVGTPTLWILDNNDGARRLYERNGFALTGRNNQLTDTLSEMEMAYTR